MRLLVFGKGQFGLAFDRFLPSRGHEVVLDGTTDITELGQVAESVAAHRPDWVINCAAKTNLDWCEQNRLECFRVNTLGADTVGQACAASGVKLLHISTGCIQESQSSAQAHREDDPPSPTSFYSWSKYWADQLLSRRAQRGGLHVLILRPRQPVSSEPSRRNALVKMLTYTKFTDTPNSVTVIEDFLDVAERLLARGAAGTYNVCNPGVTSPYQMALLLRELVEPGLTIKKISKAELNRMTFAERIDSVLDTGKLAGEGFNLKPITERLRELLPVLRGQLATHPEVLADTAAETKEKLSLKQDRKL